MRIAKRAVVLLLLAAAISAAVLYYLRRGLSAAQTATVPGLISLAPSDAPHLIYIDLTTLRSSPFLAQLMARAPAPTLEREYADFVHTTGFDYSRDLDRIVLTVQPGSPANLTVALAEGRFDREKISSYALRSGKKERQNGVEVYVVPAGTPAKVITFAFLGVNRVAIADGPSLASVLAPRPSGAFDSAMRERIARLAGSAFFAVGQLGPVPENFSFAGVRSDQLTNLMRSLRWFSLAARPEGDRLKVAVEGECDTAESARQLAGTLEGLRLLGQAALADTKTRQRLLPQTAELVETLLRLAEVSRDDQRVRLHVELTSEMVNSLPGTAARKNPSANQTAR
jgi:hypothetical protein